MATKDIKMVYAGKKAAQSKKYNANIAKAISNGDTRSAAAYKANKTRTLAKLDAELKALQSI